MTTPASYARTRLSRPRVGRFTSAMTRLTRRTRRTVLFRPAALVVLALPCSVVSGCASSEATRREAEREARDARHSHVQQATYVEDDSSPQMTMVGEEGTLNAADV